MVCYVRLYAGPGTSGDIFIHDDDEDDELPHDPGNTKRNVDIKPTSFRKIETFIAPWRVKVKKILRSVPLVVFHAAILYHDLRKHNALFWRRNHGSNTTTRRSSARSWSDHAGTTWKRTGRTKKIRGTTRRIPRFKGVDHRKQAHGDAEPATQVPARFVVAVSSLARCAPEDSAERRAAASGHPSQYRGGRKPSDSDSRSARYHVARRASNAHRNGDSPVACDAVRHIPEYRAPLHDTGLRERRDGRDRRGGTTRPRVRPCTLRLGSGSGRRPCHTAREQRDRTGRP